MTYMKQFIITKSKGNTVLCHWFAKCDQEATTLRWHPALGDVPICNRCDEWADRD